MVNSEHHECKRCILLNLFLWFARLMAKIASPLLGLLTTQSSRGTGGNSQRSVLPWQKTSKCFMFCLIAWLVPLLTK